MGEFHLFRIAGSRSVLPDAKARGQGHLRTPGWGTLGLTRGWLRGRASLEGDGPYSSFELRDLVGSDDLSLHPVRKVPQRSEWAVLGSNQ